MRSVRTAPNVQVGWASVPHADLIWSWNVQPGPLSLSLYFPTGQHPSLAQGKLLQLSIHFLHVTLTQAHVESLISEEEGHKEARFWLFPPVKKASASGLHRL